MQKPIAIINTANRPWTVIDSPELIRQWPGLQFHEYYFSAIGRPFEPGGLDIDAAVTVCAEETQLYEELLALAPVAIYLRVSPHTRSEFLVGRLREWFPDTRLLVEFYDMSAMFNRDTLDYIFAGDRELAEGALKGCEFASRCADAVIVKMGGEVFEQWRSTVSAPVATFFPSLSPMSVSEASLVGQVDRRSDDGRRVLYAGSLSARELNGGIGSVHGANVIRYFDAFADMDDCTLDIINAAHSQAAEDNSEKFAALLARYDSSQGSYTYRRAMPRQQVVDQGAHFDLGICCAHYAEDEVMDVTRCGLPNRMMTYIEAQLPVIIDDRFDYAADLVQAFAAGAVVPAGDIDAFCRQVRELDLVQARSGVIALKAWMLEKNAEVLENLFSFTREA